MGSIHKIIDIYYYGLESITNLFYLSKALPLLV